MPLSEEPASPQRISFSTGCWQQASSWAWTTWRTTKSDTFSCSQPPSCCSSFGGHLFLQSLCWQAERSQMLCSHFAEHAWHISRLFTLLQNRVSVCFGQVERFRIAAVQTTDILHHCSGLRPCSTWPHGTGASHCSSWCAHQSFHRDHCWVRWFLGSSAELLHAQEEGAIFTLWSPKAIPKTSPQTRPQKQHPNQTPNQPNCSGLFQVPVWRPVRGLFLFVLFLYLFCCRACFTGVLVMSAKVMSDRVILIPPISHWKHTKQTPESLSMFWIYLFKGQNTANNLLHIIQQNYHEIHESAHTNASKQLQ